MLDDKKKTYWKHNITDKNNSSQLKSFPKSEYFCLPI